MRNYKGIYKVLLPTFFQVNEEADEEEEVEDEVEPKIMDDDVEDNADNSKCVVSCLSNSVRRPLPFCLFEVLKVNHKI